ncbi:hypothetical protein [Pseudooceanicola nitratireducens]|nr:hypothetical protein [Pseudooceanicola nitratireducens]
MTQKTNESFMLAAGLPNAATLSPRGLRHRRQPRIDWERRFHRTA